MNLGAPELLIVLVIVLLVFGGSRLPKLARSMGQAQKEFKSGLSASDQAAADREIAAERDRAAAADRATAAEREQAAATERNRAATTDASPEDRRDGPVA